MKNELKQLMIKEIGSYNNSLVDSIADSCAEVAANYFQQKLQQTPCSTQLPPPVQKCNDCGKEDETVKKRSDGYGLQCYDCYKSDMEFEDEYR